MIALHYQLSHARRDGSLDAIVLADPSGVVVAGAGSWATCEELAAYAPFLAEGSDRPSFGTRIDALKTEVDVTTLRAGGADVLLCARGGEKRKDAMERAAKGIERILRAA